MPKFFVEPENIKEDSAIISGQDANHIAKVLRMSVGDIFTICDGCGFDYTAEISSISGDGVGLLVSDKRRCEAENNISVTVFQCLPKGSKMELIIEKCTELGADFFAPVASKYCVAKIEDAKKEAKKTEKWQKTADEAAKQCGRGVIPKVKGVVSLKEAAKLIPQFDLCIVAYEKEEEATLKSVLRDNLSAEKIGIFIGPEGGFDESEIAILKESGAKSISLGKRILRTETAGFCVISAIMYELGGF
ncbi:MAG: 16S rRNA (uracil(1498)-N(3))-methyltransferase [Clostridia bacterium]|nr:16S rRNA (uracil(1498)-N(3))-methyltransferase [Clostridia bacterium]